MTSVAEAVEAVDGGANRLELCRALDTGGLSPDPRLLRAVREAVDGPGGGAVPIYCMVRPVPGPFRVDAATLDTMTLEIVALRRAGADGLVLGVLDGAGRIDGSALSTLMEAAQGSPVTFHRAFDEVLGWQEALEELMDAGVSRVLTAGGPGSAWAGRRVLRQLVECAGRAASSLTVLGAGAIRASHARALVETTGLTEIHARASAFPALGRAFAAESDS